MKDLEREELEQSLKQNILYALEKAKNPAVKITFIFSGTHQGESFRYKENISYFAGGFTYKNVCFNSETVDKNTIINIIVDNFCYDCFSFIDHEEEFGKAECHGMGEYWGEDKFVFFYKRMNCIK